MTNSRQLVLVGFVLWMGNNVHSATRDRWSSLGLPREHIPYFFYNNPDVKKLCEEDADCPYKDLLNVNRCWGYEDNCPDELRMTPVNCPESSMGWAKTLEKQKHDFWEQADFGQIAKRKSELTTFCEPEAPGDSSLKCSGNTRYCIGKNIYIDLGKANLSSKNSGKYRSDTIPEKGLVGGKCKLNKALLQKEGDHKSFLQSWGAELEHFTEFDFHPIKDKKCDIVFDKPTVLFKLDAGVNMYHHFCDFVNLYMSQHLNNSFDRDINIVNWDTFWHGIYGDMFSDTWDVFTKNPVLMLQKYDGKKLCFKDVMLPLLARQRLGLFYNTPIIPGCVGSNLFRAYSHHTLHRLGINQDGPMENKVRITLLMRKTKYRQILNEDELVKALKTVGQYEVTAIDYRGKPFLDQLSITHNSDVFMGIHGAGLTHFLFQPDWGASFELYNCEDKLCYQDLARLRGTKYFTWENKEKLDQQDEGHHPTLGAHAKFTNYGFDVAEFMRMVAKTVAHVQSHPAFISAWEEKYKRKYPGSLKDKDEL